MTYWIIIDRGGSPVWFHDSILPGLIPDRIFDMMVDRFVDEELQLCRLCDVQGGRCHVMQDIGDGVCRKLCPVLFHDAVKPPWKVTDVI